MNPAAVLSILVKADGITKTQRQIKGLDSDLERSGKRGKRSMAMLGGAAGAAAKTGIGALAIGVPIAGAKIVDLASDAEETASKFRTVFGKDTEEATKRLDEFSKATGTSKFALREQAAQFQALIKPMGVAGKEAGGMSVGMTKLATDLASFNNSSVEEAITALQSGLVGEAEPLRRFGVQLSANRVEAFAYAQGIAKQGAELTAAQKAQAAYGIIMKDTTLAQGDATRTADSFANQWKRLKSSATDLATELGVKLLPVVTDVVEWLNKALDSKIIKNALNGDWAKAWEGLKEIVKNAIGKLPGLAKAAWELVGPAMASLGRFMLRKLRDGLSEVPGVVSGALSKIPPTVKRGWEVSGPAMFELGRFLARRFRVGVEVTAPWLWRVLKDLPGTVHRANQALNEAGRGLARAFVRGVIRGADVLGDELREKIKSEFKNALRNPEDLIPSVRIGKFLADKIGTGGAGNGTTVGPGLIPAPASVDGFNMLAARFGNIITSGYRPGDDGWHGQNRARDYSGGNMLGFARAMLAYAPRLLELIFTPLGIGVKNGQIVPISFFGSDVMADHYDHVHVAMRRGGKVPGVGAGDRVPALLEPGEWVIRKQVVDQFGPTFFAGLNGMKNGGPAKAFAHSQSMALSSAQAAEAAARARLVKKARRGTKEERLQAALALAELTATSADDLVALTALQAFYQGRLTSAQRSGNTAKITSAAGSLKGVNDSIASIRSASTDDGTTGDPNQALIASNEALRLAIEAHKASQDEVAAQLKRQTDIAKSTLATDSYQMRKWIADELSGVFGRGASNRGLTPGVGNEWSP